MQRVWVVGNSGSGKSTLAAALAERLGVPHVEIDALHHLSNWQPVEPFELRRRIVNVTADGAWVVDGNYSVVADHLRDHADTIVWLDLPRNQVMRQIVARTLRRIARREELWNGNRERWCNFFSLNEQESVIVWAWKQHGKYFARYDAMARSTDLGDVIFVRLRSRAEVAVFLQTLGR